MYEGFLISDAVKRCKYKAVRISLMCRNINEGNEAVRSFCNSSGVTVHHDTMHQDANRKVEMCDMRFKYDAIPLNYIEYLRSQFA